MSFDYVSEPAAIEQLSRQRLRATLTLPPHAPAPLVERLVYAVADPDIVPHLQWHDSFMTAAGDALNKGCPDFNRFHDDARRHHDPSPAAPK